DASTGCWDNASLTLSGRETQLRANCACAVEQHYQYFWDEANRIVEGRRFDRIGGSTGSWSLVVRQRYRYDSGNQRTIKQTLDQSVGEANPERIALYVYPGDFERRGLVRSVLGDEYQASVGLDSETQYLVGGARVVWKHGGTIEGLDRDQRITVPLTDLIQTTAAVLDLISGALLEYSTYYPNGARESYRHAEEESIAAEPSGFTGKESDEEVGLVYFGERYLISRIGRWASPDPLQVHAVGGGEPGNSYHYARGSLHDSQETLGLDPIRVGQIYVLSGTMNGTRVTYVGSTAQELRQRFSTHQWRSLLEQEGTRVTVYEVRAEPNVAASGRESMRSAVNEALRSAEQTVYERVSGRARARGVEVLNSPDAPPAGEGNARLWAERHNVQIGRGTRIPRGFALPGVVNGMFSAFSARDAFLWARDMARSRMVWALYQLEDERGTFTLHRQPEP
ncbi:MAG: hypothetical protein K8H88_02185, partial [Sandaracinaceae bacterium]|nr:hypothetical protein [Sandaracinaceae bacterium]